MTPHLMYSHLNFLDFKQTMHKKVLHFHPNQCASALVILCKMCSLTIQSRRCVHIPVLTKDNIIGYIVNNYGWNESGSE